MQVARQVVMSRISICIAPFIFAVGAWSGMAYAAGGGSTTRSVPAPAPGTGAVSGSQSSIGTIGSAEDGSSLGSGVPGSAIGSIGGPSERSPIGSVGAPTSPSPIPSTPQDLPAASQHFNSAPSSVATPDNSGTTVPLK